jgi:hypothetical protein
MSIIRWTFMAAGLFAGVLSIQAGPMGGTNLPPSKTVAQNTLPQATGGPDALFLDRFRVSALIEGGKKFRVGFVDSTTSKAYLVAQGDPFFGFVVEAMDYQSERVILRKGTARYGLSLKDDPMARVVMASAPPAVSGDSAAIHPPPGEMTAGKIKTLEDFLAEHPDLQVSEGARYDFPTNQPPAQGLGEGIESFLKLHPELEANIQTGVVTGLGPGIEAAMKDRPDLIEKARADAAGEGQGMDASLERMAREAGMPKPTISTNPTTFDDFVRMHPQMGH